MDSLLHENMRKIEIVAVNLSSEEIRQIEKISNKTVVLEQELLITVSNEKERDDILKIITAKSGRLQSLENRRETLEDLFMKKYG